MSAGILIPSTTDITGVPRSDHGAIYRVDLFGALTVRTAANGIPSSQARTLTRFRTRAAAALLAYLAYYPNQRHSRELLCDSLWPDKPLNTARGELRVSLSRLRSLLELPGMGPESVLVADRESIGLRAGAITTDVGEFTAILTKADRTRSFPDRAALLEKAVDIYPNVLLPGRYENWIFSEQDRIGERRKEALLWLARQEMSGGDSGRALSFARRALEIDPLCEIAENLLEIAMAVEPLNAVPVFKAEQSSVASSKSVNSAGETAFLIAPASQSAPDFRSATRFFGRETERDWLEMWAGGVELTCIDWERQRQFPLDTTSRLVTLTGPGGAGKTRLARETIQKLSNRNAEDGVPSVQVYTVDLTAVRDADRLPDSLAGVLGLFDTAKNSGPDAGASSVTERITSFLRAQTSPLLYLDNVEQLLPTASLWIEKLIENVPRLRCLVTSRIRLQASGELVFPVDPLPVPTAGVSRHGDPGSEVDAAVLLSEWPSVALFVDRAQLSRPDFRLAARNAGDVARLVTELEGMPLAIELAAARSLVLTPADMLAQFRRRRRIDLLTRRRRGTNDRHASLRETISWSVDILPERARCLLARLSVFRGGWSLDAAEAIAADCGVDYAALDDLSLLCDASLVRAERVTRFVSPDLTDSDESQHVSADTIRYRLLETVREYADELLTETGNDERDEACERHAAYFEKEAISAARSLRDVSSLANGTASDYVRTASLSLLRAEQENLHIALDRSLSAAMEQGAGGPHSAWRALTLCRSLHRYWRSSGQLDLASNYLQAVLKRPLRRTVASRFGSSQTANQIIPVLSALGTISLTQSDCQLADVCFRQLLWLTVRFDGPSDTRRAYEARSNLGVVALTRGRWGSARRWVEPCLAHWTAEGNLPRAGTAIGNLAIIAAEQGRLDDAGQMLSQAVSLARETGDRRAEAARLSNLAEVEYRRGKALSADTLYREALILLQNTGDEHECALTLLYLGMTSTALGETERAKWLLSSAGAVLTRLSVPLRPFVLREFARLDIADPTQPSSRLAHGGLPVKDAITRLLTTSLA